MFVVLLSCRYCRFCGCVYAVDVAIGGALLVGVVVEVDVGDAVAIALFDYVAHDVDAVAIAVADVVVAAGMDVATGAVAAVVDAAARGIHVRG